MVSALQSGCGWISERARGVSTAAPTDRPAARQLTALGLQLTSDRSQSLERGTCPINGTRSFRSAHSVRNVQRVSLAWRLTRFSELIPCETLLMYLPTSIRANTLNCESESDERVTLVAQKFG